MGRAIITIKKSRKGFTFVEVMISILIFIIGIGVIASSYIALIRQHLLAQSTQVSLNNLKLALEKIAREIKMGIKLTNTTTNDLSYKRIPDCTPVRITLENNSLKYNNIFLTDPNLIKVEQLYVTSTNTSTSILGTTTISIILSVKGTIRQDREILSFNFQEAISPINSLIPESAQFPCPQN